VRKTSLTFAAISLLGFLGILEKAQADGTPEDYSVEKISWEIHSSGFEIATARVSNNFAGLSSEILLVKLGQDIANLRVSDARDFGSKVMSVRDHAAGHKARLAINASFYDTENEPLGLIVQNGKVKQDFHRGGSLLTGIFSLKESGDTRKVGIIKSSKYLDLASELNSAKLAIQSGPRLIAGGKPLDVYRKDRGTRRSGLAILYSGEVVLFVSKARFPGTRLAQVQALFLSESLKARDVINFDGGGSSGFFLAGKPELYISGGDQVPIALVVD